MMQDKVFRQYVMPFNIVIKARKHQKEKKVSKRAIGFTKAGS